MSSSISSRVWWGCLRFRLCFNERTLKCSFLCPVVMVGYSLIIWFVISLCHSVGISQSFMSRPPLFDTFMLL